MFRRFCYPVIFDRGRFLPYLHNWTMPTKSRGLVEAVLKRIARNVRRLRLQRGYTQEAAAERSGLDIRKWQRIEADGVLTTKTLVAVAKGLGVDPSELFLSG
jgi:hypothetical protein